MRCPTRLRTMGDEGWMTTIAKARGEPVNQPDGPIRHAEKKSPGV